MNVHFKESIVSFTFHPTVIKERINYWYNMNIIQSILFKISWPLQFNFISCPDFFGIRPFLWIRSIHRNWNKLNVYINLKLNLINNSYGCNSFYLKFTLVSFCWLFEYIDPWKVSYLVCSVDTLILGSLWKKPNEGATKIFSEGEHKGTISTVWRRLNLDRLSS